MKIIKKVVEIGNGAAVYVPKEYRNQQVLVILPESIEEIKKTAINKLSIYLPNIIGIYFVGSYARSEQTPKSDIDILVITENLNKRIKDEPYDIILVSADVLKKQIEENALPIIPMLKEAKVILNSGFISELRNSKLTGKNLRFHIETSKSALNVIEEAIKISEKQKEKMSDNIVYSLILRLREAYIVECLIKNKLWSNKKLIELIREISGREEAYYGYTRAKNNENDRKKLKIQEAKKIYEYIKSKIKWQERWAGKRK